MKLQESSKKEVKRIAIGVGICSLILIGVLFLLSLVGVGSFSFLPVMLGALGGSAVAVGNFAIMCLTIQKAVATADEKLRKNRIQASYNLRLMLQAAWVVIAFLIPWLHVIAAAVPLLFPTVVIYYLQWKGKLVSASDRKEPSADNTDEPEDRLESFEA